MRSGTNAAVGRYGGTAVYWWSRLRAELPSVIRRICGAPDYGAYLEHCRLVGHPPRLSEREYVRECFEAKGKGVRCC